jgi:NADH-quinone oxidoreductase subunit L
VIDPETLLDYAMGGAVMAPFTAFLILGTLWLLGRTPGERTTSTVVNLALTTSLVGSLAVVWALWRLDFATTRVDLGDWFRIDEYRFELNFLADGLSATMMTLVSVITLFVGRFSVNYLHRERGFFRFFALLSVFASAMLLLVTAGSFDLLFAGWELVGLTSILLVAFFHERSGPTQAAIRVMITYRLCDVGLLIGAAILHHHTNTSLFAELRTSPAVLHLGPFYSSLVGLCFLVAAAGKSALFPMGSWLPRAMEGPTASSALFYASLSVHAGVYLLLRAEPLIEHAPVARAAMIGVGAVTAVHATMVARTQTDAKSRLAYAAMTQVGVMVIEVALGFNRLATLHLVTHALLRGYQMLLAPSSIHRQRWLMTAHGQEALPTLSVVGARLSPASGRAWYRLALDRFHLDVVFEQWFGRAFLRVGTSLDQLELKSVKAVARTVARGRAVDTLERSEPLVTPTHSEAP